jgi:AraC-like DNA-binding protein
MDQYAQESGLNKKLHLTESALFENHSFQIFDRFHRSLETSQDPLVSESYLARGVQFLMEKCSEQPLSVRAEILRRPLDKVRGFLLENWCNKVSLQQLAGIAGLSRFHFLRSFSQHFGLPPHAFQRQIRITKACDLIKKGFPVTGIDHGFSDQSHFIRHFKKIVGITPGSYASMVRPPFSGASVCVD